jgi:hypothetical protein
MTTVTQGTTSTYTFAANEMVTLALSGGQQARVEVVDATTGKVKYGSSAYVSETFGPFNANDTLAVTSIRGAVVYTISTYIPPATGGGAFSTITGHPTDNSELATELQSLLNIPPSWDGSTPALASGVNPITAGFGSNAFTYTGVGTSPALDGYTYVNGETAVFGWGGINAWTKFSPGGAYLGSFANTGALPTASLNTGNFALVGTVFYQSNGTAWALMGGASVALPTSTSWATMWDTAGTKDMGEFTISAALALTSSDLASVVGGYTQAVIIADGSHTPTADGNAIPNWVNTNGTRNRVTLRRTGNSKVWEAGTTALTAVVTPVNANISTAPVIDPATPGAAVTWTSGTVTGTPTPTISYSLKKNGTVVANPATSGAYSSTVNGDVLIVTENATNAAYGGGAATPVDSSPVTVSSGAVQFLNQTFSGTTGTAITSLTPATGGAWSVQSGFSPASPNAIDTAGTALYSPTSSGSYQNAATPPSANYYVEAVMTMLSSVSADNVSITGRADTASNTLYFAGYSVTAGGWRLFKVVAGTATQLGTTQTDAWSSGSRTVRLTMTGTTIALAVGGSTLISVTDTAISAAGKAGVRYGLAQGPSSGIHINSIVAST